MMPLSAGIMTAFDVEAMRVDREREMNFLLDALTQRSQNVLIHGVRGVGKSFLVKVLEHRLKTSSPDTLVTYIDVSGCFFRTPPEHVPSAFPRWVLLQMCQAIWTELLGHPYSDLRRTLDEGTRDLHFRGGPEKTIVETFNALMSVDRKVRTSWHQSLGVSAAVKGEKQDGGQVEWSAPPLLSFEFHQFVKELNEKVVRPRGIRRLVALCDEVNLLKQADQEEIVQRHLQLFASHQVQFVIVVGRLREETALPAESGFECVIPLGGLPTRDDTAQCVLKHLDRIGKTVTQEALDVVWEMWKGHPRDTLEVFEQACFLADEAGAAEISAGIVARAGVERRQAEEHRQAMLKFL